MALNPALIYDPRGHTFESWASLICEQYAAQNIEIPNARTDWREWGNGLLAIDVFANEAVPRTERFTDWFDWAEAMVNAVNPYTASTG
jgi:hypothetical protein